MKKTRRLLALLLAVLMLAALAVPALAEGEEPLADGEYSLPELACSLGMFNHFVDGTQKLVVAGETATLSFVTDGSTASIQKYSKIALGKASEVLTDAVDGYQAELPEGVTVIEGVLQPKENEDDPDRYFFEVAIPTADVSAELYIILWNKNGAEANGYVPGWYKAKNDAYLTLGTPVAAEAPAGEEPAGETPAAEAIELAITNNLNMFKAVSASLVTDGENGEFIVFALSGTGYKNIFKGTYEQAVENGDATDNWIAASENADGKLEFRVPVAPDETVVPIVAISNSKYESYLAGENTLERAFYPRQLTLDREAKTLVTDDYKASDELAVTNNVKMFKVASATLDTAGGPNSNGYKSTLVLTMGSDSFDGAYVGRASEIAEGTETIAVAERVFELPVRWMAEAGKPESIVNKLAEPFVVSFHSVKNDAWYERLFTVDEAAKTLTIDEVPEESPFTDVPDGMFYTEAVAWAVGKGIAAGYGDTLFFGPDDPCTRGQVVTFLWRAAGKPAAEGTNPFTDVAEGAYYYDAVLWAVANEITTGVSETEFAPDAPCTRDQVVTFMWRAAGKPAAESAAAFTDVAEGSFYADAVAWAVEKGITTGYSDTLFGPGDPCTRGQVVTFLWREYK
ncbi:MAG: S-layer homology domain-containing protein [Oscillospiraceae bacterium]|nr:S-layer homology domain-containing protein [Oscillospiraceae bacterium]